MRNTHAKCKPQTKGTVLSVCKIVSNWYCDWYCRKWRIFLAQNEAKEGFCIGNDIQVVPKKMQWNSVRNLMCVGRYVEKTQWSEAKWNLFEPLARSNLFGQMPAIDISAECDNIKLLYNGEIASRWDAYLLCDLCRHFASVMLRLASLISHNLRCIPAYTHQIPMGFFSP